MADEYSKDQERIAETRIAMERAKKLLPIRIEALRAASVVVAPTWAVMMEAGLCRESSDPDKLAAVDAATLRCAKQFAAWLETG